MLLITYTENGLDRVGHLDRKNGEVVDISRHALNMPAFIARGEAGLEAAMRALESAPRQPLAKVKLAAPIPRPARNIFCVGKNYRDHVQELQGANFISDAKESLPEVPIFFTKATTTVIGPGQPIPAALDPTHSVDYEGELAVIIGRGGRGIARADAMRHVYGYTIVNDVTSRTLQSRHRQWFLGKSLDGFCPMGPVIVTVDEVPDVTKLQVQTLVNGELRQDSTVANLIFDIPQLIEALSLALTLEPGDIIATGTPAGVGMGFKPPRFLQPGDTVAVTIEPIGTLENTVN